MFKCVTCGEVFDTPETKSGYLCECGDHSVYEDYGVCPYCGSDDYREAKRCEDCDEYCLDDELFGGVCVFCISEYENDIDGCYELTANSKQSVEINEFLAAMFTEGEIEELLMRQLKEAKASCKKFIEKDKAWVGDLILSKEQKK